MDVDGSPEGEEPNKEAKISTLLLDILSTVIREGYGVGLNYREGEIVTSWR